MVEHLVTEAVSVFLIDADWTAQIASARHHPWLQFPCRAEPPYGLGANRCVSSDSMATHPKTQAKKERETQREGPEEAGGPKGEEERWSTISLSSSLLFSSLLSSVDLRERERERVRRRASDLCILRERERERERE